MLGPRKEQNPYTAELSAISQALRFLPDHIQRRNIYIITRGLSAVQGLMQPKQHSGQMDIKAIYEAWRLLRLLTIGRRTFVESPPKCAYNLTYDYPSISE